MAKIVFRAPLGVRQPKTVDGFRPGLQPPRIEAWQLGILPRGEPVDGVLVLLVQLPEQARVESPIGIVQLPT